MRKIFLICLVVITITDSCYVVFAKNNTDDVIYEEFMDKARNYDELDFISSSEEDDFDNSAKSIFDKLIKFFVKEFKLSAKNFISLLMICIVFSLVKAFISKSTFAGASEYGIYCLCGIIVVSGFKATNDICISAIDNLSDFMDIAVPMYATVLSACGYATTAVSVQSLFMVISVILTHVIKDLICPLLFCCGLVSVVTGISGAVDLGGIIKLISGTVKYALGIIMTVFAGVLAFTGFSSTATDSLALQTAKFAVANFVPVVGGCLSGALNSLKQSSLVLKNSMGYIGFLVMLSLGFIPVVKILVSIFSFRLSASVAHLFGESKLGSILDSVCNVLVTMGATVVLVGVIFVLIIGVISMVG